MLLHQYILETNSIGKTVDISLHKIFKKGIMCKVDKYIAKRSKQSTKLAREYKEESQQMQINTEICNLHDETNKSQCGAKSKNK
ncbi:MAG TPA: hypothetical protein H9718_03710 [Candidatus Limosilactobacillus gallistercoris]|nr:hypothetical protein [Candidatus Limosilactobacillus gallistercoris]